MSAITGVSRRLFPLLSMSLVATALALAPRPSAASQAEILELTQTSCQFVEVEQGGDHGFVSRTKADCEAINAETGAERLAQAKTLRLKPGTYVFRVTNKSVPYPLGFWLRESGYDEANYIKRLTMTSVSGGGLDTGKTKDYRVELEPGEYLYSCPLNPTPNYRIIVEG
jgi:hypothetical protein